MDDHQLIQDFLDGNREAFARLVQRHQDAVFRTAMGMVHQAEDAEEITQDVFLRVYDSLSGFRGESSFSTWLYRITLRLSLNFLRRRKRARWWERLTRFSITQTAEPSPDSALEQSALRQELREALNRLPAKQKMAFVLSRYEELPQKKVAAILHCSEGAVEQLLLRARHHLQKDLKKKGTGA